MPSTETLVWIISGLMPLFIILGGVIWKMLRDEAKDQAEQIKKKADSERVLDIEKRFRDQLIEVKDGNEKLITKLEQRQQRDIDQVTARLSEQIKSTEQNILAQLRMMLGVLNTNTSHNSNKDN